MQQEANDLADRLAKEAAAREISLLAEAKAE